MIDLHLHLDGSLTPEIVTKLAKIQCIALPSYDNEELRKLLCVPKDCGSLNDYLKCFDLPLSLFLDLIIPQAIRFVKIFLIFYNCEELIIRALSTYL